MTSQHRVRFDSLPRITRERFVQALDDGSPRPFLVEPVPFGSTLAQWSVVGLVASMALGVLVWWGYGDPLSLACVHGPAWASGYVVLLVLVLWSLGRLARRLLEARTLPWTPGRYVFPLDLVDARTSVLRIVSLDDLEVLDRKHRSTNGVYTHSDVRFRFADGPTEVFTVRGRELADRVLVQRQFLADLVRASSERGDLDTLRDLDLFWEVRSTGAWEEVGAVDPEGPHARPLPRLLHRPLVPALIAAALLAPPLLLARNRGSESMAIATLRTEASTAACEGYLRTGRRHLDEVREVLLPAAAYREARTADALRDVLARYPDAPWREEARASLHRLHTEALDQLGAPPEHRPVVVALMAELEARGTTGVPIRFHPSAGLPPCMEDGRSILRERAAAKVVQRRLAELVPRDLLWLEPGPRLLPHQAAGPFSGPTLTVAYAVAPPPPIYESETPPLGSVEFSTRFAVALHLSDQVDAFTLEVLPPPEPPPPLAHPELGAILLATPGGPSQLDRCEQVALNAFDRLVGEVQGRWFPGAD